MASKVRQKDPGAVALGKRRWEGIPPKERARQMRALARRRWRGRRRK